MSPKVIIYPGTFDPLTYGHIDIIKRGANLGDQLIVAVSLNSGKQPLFSIDERTALVMDEVERINANQKTSLACQPTGFLPPVSVAVNSSRPSSAAAFEPAMDNPLVHRTVSWFSVRYKILCTNRRGDPSRLSSILGRTKCYIQPFSL